MRGQCIEDLTWVGEVCFQGVYIDWWVGEWDQVEIENFMSLV